MFSTIPKILTFKSCNIFIPFKTSIKASFWGVVTITPPSSFTSSQILKLISPVPGGVSIIKKSNFPHYVCKISCEAIDEAIGPLIVEEPFETNPKDMHFTPFTYFGMILFGLFDDD